MFLPTRNRYLVPKNYHRILPECHLLFKHCFNLFSLVPPFSDLQSFQVFLLSAARDSLHVGSSVLPVFEKNPHLFPLQCPFLAACAWVHHVPKDDWLWWRHQRYCWKHWWHAVFLRRKRWNSGASWWQEDKSPCCSSRKSRKKVFCQTWKEWLLSSFLLLF